MKIALSDKALSFLLVYQSELDQTALLIINKKLEGPSRITKQPELKVSM